MSTKYQHGDRVPTDVIRKRLEELSDAITKGRPTFEREFTMRIPAELDRDPDLVLSAAARRLKEYEMALRKLISDVSKCEHTVIVDIKTPLSIL